MSNVVALSFRDSLGAKADHVRGSVKDLTLDSLKNDIQAGGYFRANEDGIEIGRSRRFDFANGFSVRIIEQGKKGFAALEENKTVDGRIEFTPGTKALALGNIEIVGHFLKDVAARPNHANARVSMREEEDGFLQDRPVYLSREKLETLKL